MKKHYCISFVFIFAFLVFVINKSLNEAESTENKDDLVYLTETQYNQDNCSGSAFTSSFSVIRQSECQQSECGIFDMLDIFNFKEACFKNPKSALQNDPDKYIYFEIFTDNNCQVEANSGKFAITKTCISGDFIYDVIYDVIEYRYRKFLNVTTFSEKFCQGIATSRLIPFLSCESKESPISPLGPSVIVYSSAKYFKFLTEEFNYFRFFTFFILLLIVITFIFQLTKQSMTQCHPVKKSIVLKKK